MIQFLGFLDISLFAAQYMVKYKAQLREGVLKLRDVDADDVLQPIVDQPILAEWKTAKSLLQRMRNLARTTLKAPEIDLGKAWVETLPGGQAIPWQSFEDDYAQDHIRTRTGLILAPDCFTYSGHFKEMIGYGAVNVVEHRILHSETNFSAYPRTHLVVDIQRPAHADKEQ